ncbi:MAG: oligopeptide transporter, OPT family [Planctomycetota bacterium]|nr:oligopeptide transporter, OPT family [Planctomycetota bacterium]MEC8513212.1 oligopeptide transporter, OPT family [Planctomycetota bacterium]
MTDPAAAQSVAAPRRELTLRALFMGLLLAVVMGAANVYVGLKVGMTVSASIPAAVMAMLVFRYVFRDRSILEANQVQTCASAGESLAAGIIFTMPALIVMGTWTEFDFWTVTGVAFTGGLLGILLMIPMRKVFITESSELPYPEGIACAAVLETGDSEGDAGAADAAKGLILGGLLGAGAKVLVSFFGIVQGTKEAAIALGDRVLYFGSDISPMLVGVGYIVRLNVAILLFAGGAIGWLVLIPAFGGATGWDGTADALAWDLWDKKIRYVGVGAMVVGGLASIVAVRRGLVEAIRHLTGSAGGDAGSEHERDLPTGVIIGFSLLAVGLIAVLYHGFTGGSVGATAALTVVMVVAAFFFTAVASYIVGLVGNSNSPVSGMTITAVLFAGGILYLIGFKGPDAAVATIGVAAIVCCVACTSGDVCNDLKTGAIVGASPIRQQTMQIAGVAVASLVMAPVMALLHAGTEGGIGGPNLNAPQAVLFSNLARGFSGEIELPWDMILIGAGIGVALLVVDGILKATNAPFRAYVMPIAVGIYLPFSIAPPILVGGLISALVLRGSRSEEEAEQRSQRGVLFSSGVIAGEALVGVALAGLAVAGLKEIDHGLGAGAISLITWAAIAGGLGLFVSRTRPRSL